MPLDYRIIDGVRQFSPDHTPKGWRTFGSGALFPTADDTNGYYADEALQGASAAVEITDDGVVPQTARINWVAARYRIAMDALIKQGPLPIHPYIRYFGGGVSHQGMIDADSGAPSLFERPTAQPVLTFTYSLSAQHFEAYFFADPHGQPWTRESIFRKQGAPLRLGLVAGRPIDGQTADVKWTRVEFDVNFTLLSPVVRTLGADLVGANTAQLNGSIDPRGTNASYPFSYYFEWGPTTALGFTTPTTGGVFGDAPLVVSAPISGLSQGVTYYFRIVVLTPEETLRGVILTFVTDNSITPGRWRLDEFKRVATGTFTAADRTRETSEGFDRNAGSSEAAGCPDLEF